MTPEIVNGQTYHRRVDGPDNAFRYGVDYMLFEPEAETRFPWLCSRNRLNVTSLNDKDHGGRRGNGIGAPWVRQVLRKRGLGALAEMRVLLLAQPRMLGHWFNPVSFWLVLDDKEQLRAVIAEVNNTFGDRHSYLCHHDDVRAIEPADTLTARKIFYVSPFQPIAGGYSFKFNVTPDRIAIRIELSHGEAGGLIATLTGKRRPLSNSAILNSLVKRPAGSLRVLGLIYLQALVLRYKKATFRSRPEPPLIEVS